MNWNTTKLPDSDTTVLLRLADEADPIASGFHDGERWRYANAGTVDVSVIGWMELHDAAKALDHVETLLKAVHELRELLPLEPHQLDAYVQATFLPAVKAAVK